MNKIYSKYLENAVNALSELPGIGRKSALRIALHLLAQPLDKVGHLNESIMKMRSDLKECKRCFNLAEEQYCSLCLDQSRLKSTICVVEGIRDVMAIEETGQYNGQYHVLGGVISPIEGVGPERLHIDQLVQRIHSEGIKELIMAISPTIDGETTIYYISKKLEMTDIKLSQIARGVAFGGELQYTDEVTLGRSIIARIPYATNGDS